MKPSSRIQAGIEILEAVAKARVPMDSMVGDYMRGRRYIGAKDRAEIAERVYSIVRHYARLGWWVAHKGAPDTVRVNVIAHMALVEGMNAKRIGDLFDASNYSPKELDDAEKDFAIAAQHQGIDHPDMSPATRLECPPQHEPALRDFFKDDFEAEMAAMLRPAPLDIRTNVFMTTRDDLKKSLAQDGIETDETPYSPWGLRARGKAYLAKSKAFHKGHVEIQDEGSQLIAHVCGAQPGMQVLDYCAGGGGKTLALAAAMNRKGRIVAMDTDPRRLEKGRQRFRKAKIADIIEVRPLSDDRHRKWLRRQKETFDIVLADVPCSGSGTWRRNPDLRWNQYGPTIDDLRTVQAEILDKIAPCVKIGGRIVYATCSLFASENESQITAFLKRHPNFEIVPPENKILGAPFMRLTPHRHSTDGFFAAALRRV